MINLAEYFPTNYGTEEKPNHGFSIHEFTPKRKPKPKRPRDKITARFRRALSDDQLAAWQADIVADEIEQASKLDYLLAVNYDGGEEPATGYHCQYQTIATGGFKPQEGKRHHRPEDWIRGL